MQDSGNITYYAQELIQDTYNITRINLVMRGINPSNIRVRRGDTLADDWPYFDDNDPNGYQCELMDCVVSNPPYSHKWEANSHATDPRYKDYGTAPASKADYAFLLHDLYHLKEDGIMCIVMPHGVLFRGGSEKEIRSSLVEHNNIECIIGLPANCFYGTGIPTIIMVLKKHREASDILIVDASKEFIKEGSKNRLSGHHIKKIVDAVLARETIPHFAVLVSKDKVKENDYNLNIPRYVQPEGNLPADLYAAVFGGIPNYELDRLNKYWEAFASLREKIFARVNEHSSVVSCNSVKDAISGSYDIAAFEEKYSAAFKALEAQLYTLLIDGWEENADNTHVLKTQITQEIFAICAPFNIVDKYLVYKAFDDNWEQISNDLDALRLDGLDAARSVEPVEVYDKKEKETVIKGEEGRLIPFKLIQKFLFADEFLKMEALDKELERALSEYESFWADLDEELKNELKKEDDGQESQEANIDMKLLKGKYQEILASLSDETTKKYEEYLGLTPRQKVEFQDLHAELEWPAQTEKGANGVYKAAAVKSIIQQLKNEIYIPEEEEDYKIRRLYLLSQSISGLKKQIKEFKTELDNKAREAIVSLSDGEIKMLLREKWLTPVMQSINRIPSDVQAGLNILIQEIIDKYKNPVSELDEEIIHTQNMLFDLLDELTGNQIDMEAVRGFKELLGGAGK